MKLDLPEKLYPDLLTEVEFFILFFLSFPEGASGKTEVSQAKQLSSKGLFNIL